MLTTKNGMSDGIWRLRSLTAFVRYGRPLALKTSKQKAVPNELVWFSGFCFLVFVFCLLLTAYCLLVLSAGARALFKSRPTSRENNRVSDGI